MVEGCGNHPLNGVRIGFTDPVYRAFLVAMLLQGIAVGGTLPYIPLWATTVLGVGPTEAGLLQTFSGVAGVALSFFLGHISDRTNRRAPWIFATMAFASIASLLLATVSNFLFAGVLYAVASASVFGILFALLSDWLRHRQQDEASVVHSTVRVAYTMGWAIGPVVAAYVVDLGSYPILFMGMAAVQAAMALLIKTRLPDPPARPAPMKGHDRLQTQVAVGYGPLIAYSAAVFCVSGAIGARYVVMPLYISQHLGRPASDLGIVLLASALAQVPLMIMAGYLAERWKVVPLLLAGHVITAIHYVAYISCPTYWQIFLLQPVFAAGHVTWNCVGIRHAQDLLPGRAGTAMAYYDSASRLGPLVASPILGHLIAGSGYQVAFGAGAAMAVASLCIFVLSGRRDHPVASGRQTNAETGNRATVAA